jgi:nucleoside-diphosphate-sugar epimerase
MVGDVDSFLFGATVVLGSRTVRRLVAADHRVTALVRSGAEEAALLNSAWRTDDRIRGDDWIAEETEPAPHPRSPRYATPRAGRSAEPAGWAL